MSVPYQIPLQSSDLIAIVAVIISGLSALYARWASSEAKRANEISLLSHRKAIYDAFFELKMHMDQQAMRAQMEQVSKFYYPIRDASVYFEKSLSEKVAQYYSQCLNVAGLASVGNALYPNESDEIKKSVADAATLAEVIEQEMSGILRKNILKS